MQAISDHPPDRPNDNNADASSTAKFSREMRASLDNMRSFLKCHICNNDMENPATLHCGHSFCFDCIADHSTQPGKKGFDCPVFGCGQSITAGKTAGKKSITPNATMAQIMQGLNSLEEKCRRAHDYWYKRQGTTGGGAAAVSGDVKEDNVFTFQMDHRKNDRSGDNGSVGESSHSTASSTSTKPYVCPTRTTMSIDQSLFSTTNAQNISKRESEPTPDFSSSPIPMSNDETQTASQLEKVLASVNKDGAAAEPDAKQPAVKYTATKAKGGCHDDRDGKRKSSSAGDGSKDDGQEKKQPADPRRGRGKKRARDNEKDEEGGGEKPTSKSPRRPRVSFQPRPQVMLLNSSLSLSSKDSRCLRKLKADGMISILRLDETCADEFDSGLDFDAENGRELFLTTLSSDRTNNSISAPLRFYGIGTEKDEEFSMAADGVVAKRSFLFYVAVACGLSMVDIAFVTDMANKRAGNQSHSKYLHPSSLGANQRNRSAKKDDSSAHRIIGGSNYNWYAPQRAYENAVERHAEWLNKEEEETADSVLLPGTDLLGQYSVLLLGEYDPANHSKRATAKRKKQQQHGGRQDCTKGNVTLLLQLCGARVYDVGAVASSKCIRKGLSDKLEALKAITPLRSSNDKATSLADMLATTGDKTLIVVNDRPSAKLGKEVLTAISGDLNLNVPIVSSRWLLDSIGDFEVKQTADYSLET